MAWARKYRSQTNTTDFIRKTNLNCISAPTPLFCSSWIKACFPAWINPAMRSGSNVASVSKVLNTKPWKEQRKHSTINCYLKSPHYFLCLEFFFGWPLVYTTMATATKTAKLSLDQQNNKFARTSPFCTFLCRHCMTMAWKCLKSRFIMKDVTTRLACEQALLFGQAKRASRDLFHSPKQESLLTGYHKTKISFFLKILPPRIQTPRDIRQNLRNSTDGTRAYKPCNVNGIRLLPGLV